MMSKNSISDAVLGTNLISDKAGDVKLIEKTKFYDNSEFKITDCLLRGQDSDI